MKGNAYVPFMLRRGDGSTLSLDFTAMGGTLDSRFTFTRSSTTSTYINSSGLVATAGTNVPRFEYDPTTLTPRGLLIEGAATNLVTNSQNITTSTWTVGGNTTLTANTTDVTDPAGGNTATKIALSASAYCSRAQQVTVLANTAYTFSFWIRGTAGSTQRVFESGGGDLVSQTTLTYTNTGWTRVQIRFTSATITTIFVYVCSKSTSAGSSDVLYAWGAQLELGSDASSYIPTVGSTVQRTADTCIAASTGFSSWFTGGTSGTFYADWYGGVRGITSTVRTVLSTSDVTGRHLHLQQTAAAGNLKVADFGAANAVTTLNSITSGARTKGAFSFSGNTVNLTLNGGTVATSSSIAFSTAPTWLVLGGVSTNGTTITDATVLLNGSIRAIKYWPSVLPTATLQSLTT
jgi:hypothetical protein